jgi:hypothetical protein
MLESQKKDQEKMKRDGTLVDSVLMAKFNDSHLTKSENEFEIEFDPDN